MHKTKEKHQKTRKKEEFRCSIPVWLLIWEECQHEKECVILRRKWNISTLFVFLSVFVTQNVPIKQEKRHFCHFWVCWTCMFWIQKNVHRILRHLPIDETTKKHDFCHFLMFFWTASFSVLGRLSGAQGAQKGACWRSFSCMFRVRQKSAIWCPSVAIFTFSRCWGTPKSSICDVFPEAAPNTSPEGTLGRKFYDSITLRVDAVDPNLS